MPAGIDAMKAACKATGINHHEEFAQMVEVQKLGIAAQAEGAQGLCFGLSAGWLDAMVHGKGSEYLDNVKQGRDGSLLPRSALMWKNQRNDAVWLKLTALKPALDDAGNKKDRSFLSGDPRDEEKKMEAFVKWMSAAKSQRYFMVHTRTHCMAAAGRSGGDLYFFDPNGGVVTTKDSNKMLAFLNSYFSQRVVLETYGDEHRVIAFKVVKYKS